MAQYIEKAAVVAEIEKKRDAALTRQRNLEAIGQVTVLNETLARELNRIISFINTLEVKEVDLTDEKTNWCPSKKQMESLHDLLKYNIGVFDYKKCMEVNSLYEDLTKILDYETDRQKVSQGYKSMIVLSGKEYDASSSAVQTADLY